MPLDHCDRRPDEAREHLDGPAVQEPVGRVGVPEPVGRRRWRDLEPRLRFGFRTCTAFEFWRQWAEISSCPFAQLNAATSARRAMFWYVGLTSPDVSSWSSSAVGVFAAMSNFPPSSPPGSSPSAHSGPALPEAGSSRQARRSRCVVQVPHIGTSPNRLTADVHVARRISSDRSWPFCSRCCPYRSTITRTVLP